MQKRHAFRAELRGITWMLFSLLLVSNGVSLGASASVAQTEQAVYQLAFERLNFLAPYRSNLYILDVETGTQGQITNNASDAQFDSVSWSPDGNTVAYGLWSNLSEAYANFGHFNIYVMDIQTLVAH